jgi:hypothetical protein
MSAHLNQRLDALETMAAFYAPLIFCAIRSKTLPVLSAALITARLDNLAHSWPPLQVTVYGGQ